MFEERARAVAVEDFLFTFVDTFMRFKLELVLCEWFSSPGQERGLKIFSGKQGNFLGIVGGAPTLQLPLNCRRKWQSLTVMQITNPSQSPPIIINEVVRVE
jgi:hypothetical protein